MFHAVAGMIVGGKMDQERVGVEFRWTPHRGFSAHDFFNVAYQSWALAALVAKRMDHYMVGLPINLKLIFRPVWRDFSWGINHHVVVRKLPPATIGAIGSPVDDAPTRRRIDRQRHWIRLVIDNVHKQAATVEICVT